MCRRKQFFTIVEAQVGGENRSVCTDDGLYFKLRLAVRIESAVTNAARVRRDDAAAVWSPLLQGAPKRGQIAQIAVVEWTSIEVEDCPDRAHRIAPSHSSQLSISRLNLLRVVHNPARHFDPGVRFGREFRSE